MPEWETCAKYLLECTRDACDGETLKYRAGDVIGVVDVKHGVYHEARMGDMEGLVMWDERSGIIRSSVVGACNKLSELVVNNYQRHSLKDVLPGVVHKVLVPLQGVFMRNYAVLDTVHTGDLEDLLLKISLLILSVAKSKYTIKKKFLVSNLKHYYSKLKHEVSRFAVEVATKVSVLSVRDPSPYIVRSPTLPVSPSLPPRSATPPPIPAPAPPLVRTSVEVQTTEPCAAEENKAEKKVEVADPYWGEADMKDPQQAASAWRVAANVGCSASMVELGKLCEEGPEPSKHDAAVWYRYAAERGNAEGQYRLALLLLSYDADDKKLMHEAEQLLASSAASLEGHPKAAVHLGWLYEASLLPSRKPLSNAARWYRLAADCGSTEAHAHVGYCKIIKGHFLSAVDYLQVAVQNNEPEGMHAMAMLYLHGLGVPKDPKIAKQLFKRAAHLGHGGSLQQLANYLYTANRLPEAVVAYKKAALLGDPEACKNLAAISGPKEQEYWERRAHKITKSYHRWSRTVLESLVSSL
eukprot:TRINITY_DN4505_c0_g1_i1.p1 TRINITY_DN4505_c0_g1~~TRINITY_DN4505_c0_g1_i1.p1  ORF type:complete len:524 (+),score=125.07 TRINITY_DN4505_c0_g1_i1:264-1835(+)